MKRPAAAGPSSSVRAEPRTSCSSAERPASALRSFFSSAASSNSGGAERPAVAASTGSTAASSNCGSAEQPGSSSHLQLSSIRDVQRWLAKEPIASCVSADTERIREAVDKLTSSKKGQPRREDVEYLLGPKNWNVEQRSNQKRIPFPDIIREFKGKVIEAAQKRQQQLSDSAEQPASSTVEEAAPMDTTHGEEWLHDFRARQRKRAADSLALEQRAVAKPKATKRTKKRTAGTIADSAEEPAAKRKDMVLTQQLFAAGAREPSDRSAPSLDSAIQRTPLRQQEQFMVQMVDELVELSDHSFWTAVETDVKLKAIIKPAALLRQIPARQRILKKRPISALYMPICGGLGVRMPLAEGSTMETLPRDQDYTHVSLVSCYKVESEAIDFVQTIDEISESTMERYPCLWELKNRQHDAMSMPRSTQDLFESLKDIEASASTPYGRLPIGKHSGMPFLKCAEYFVRMLALLELPNHSRLKDLPIPRDHTKLIDQIMQYRANAAEASAEQPAFTTASHIREILQAFADDPYCCHVKKRWLCNVLKVPKEKQADPEYLPQILETAVDEFLQELHANVGTGPRRSKHTLAALALYHRILIIWKKKCTGPMHHGPVLRMLGNTSGRMRKQYLSQEQCGEDVELAANRMPAYWRRMQDSAGQRADDLSLGVASPPVMCWICGEGLRITGVNDYDPDSAEQPVKGFLVDDIQLLTPEMANTLKTMLMKQLTSAALCGQVSRKRAHEPWSASENPADAGPCRKLGRSPTGPTLSDYTPSPAKRGA